MTNTKSLLEKLKSDNILDTYAVFVHKGSDEAVILSDNADMDTYFDIASMGKVLVTSTLILKAIGEGKLSLDDTLGKFFDNVPPDKQSITVKQLLTHTSGIIRAYDPSVFYPKIKAGNDAIAEYILSCKLGYEPDSDYAYSCFGYVLLGFIVEKVYGNTLDRVFDEYIKSPLGLERVGFNIPLDTPNMAVTHYRADIGDCACADDIAFRMKGVAGNGCSFWTLREIKKYIEAVMRKDESLYKKELFCEAERDYTPDFAEGRGLGYLVVDERYKQSGKLFGSGSFGHCGNTGTSFFIDRENDIYVILLTNATRFSYIKHGFKDCDYSVTMKMREDVHNMILSDIS